MKDLLHALRSAALALVVFTALCGVVYPVAMIAIGAVIPHPDPQELVGRSFDDPAYFWGRPSATSYNAMTSSGMNQGPSGFVDDKGTLGPNDALVNAVKARIQALRDADPGNTAKLPIDLVTASGSGLDPHISPAAAHYQSSRIARVRNVSIDKVKSIVDTVTEERTFGVLGERRVNVVRLNRALDAITRPQR